MSRRLTQVAVLLLFVCFPALAFASPQVTAASAAADQSNAQGAAAQVTTAQAAATQATAQVTAAQGALRQAIMNMSKAPAGATQTAAQAAVQTAEKQVVAAQTTARQAVTNLRAAQLASAQAARQAAQDQAALAQQAAATAAAQPTAAVSTAKTAVAAAAVQPTAALQTASGGAAGSESSGSGGAASGGGNSTLNTVLGGIFGGGSKASTPSTPSKGKKPAVGATNDPPTDTAVTPDAPAPTGQALVANNRNTRGAQPNPAAPAPDTAAATTQRKPGFSTGALGVGQSTDTLLTVYGCNRLGTQVTCDTDISNQNNSVTQMNSTDQWKDVYLQDDAGDNHLRSMGMFENNNGDQRSQITLPYGEKSRYILVFNGVPANVKNVTLKSTANVLDVESIPVANPGGAPAQSQASGAAPVGTAPAVVQPATAPAAPTQGRVPHS